MKKTIFILFTLTLCLSVFSGCAETECEHNWERVENYDRYTAVDKCKSCGETRMYTDPDAEKSDESKTSNEANNNILVREGTVKTVNVGSLPGYYDYSFAGESAERIVEYLEGLNLSSDFPENPDKYSGMTWVISLEYDDGITVTVYHFGNMFIRVEGEPWYKMTQWEAARFETLLEELNKAPMEFSENQSLLKYKDGKYVITLPASGIELEVDEYYEHYLSKVTDELIISAEQSISADVAEYTDNSSYYLVEDNGHLCLSMEVIKMIDPPKADEGDMIVGGCDIDHEHLFFSARISQ